MNKIFKGIILILILSFISINVSASTLIKSKEFKINKRLKTNLSQGEWYLVEKKGDSYYGIIFDNFMLAKVENNEIFEIITLGIIKAAGVYESTVNQVVVEIFFKNKHDGCYERPEYYLLELYKRGNTVNCMKVRHFDVLKELNNPDDPETKGDYASLKKWAKDKNYIFPKIMLNSSHQYFSRLVRGELVEITYTINPKALNAPETKYFTEETSEYHKYNIDNYPEHKKVMEKFVSISAERHKEFEKNHKAKKHHLLDLNKYISSNSSIENKSDVVDNLKKLNDLYKSGVLTKEEFEKAKKKILN